MQSSPPSDFDEGSVLRQWDETDDKWSWSDSDRGEWKVVTDKYQQFYEHWHGTSAGSFSKNYPYELSLGVDEYGQSLLPFQDVGASESRLLVTKSYEDIFQRILRRREQTSLPGIGVVLTGQPGTGKTTFLKFMLARLISNRQVVLLLNNARAHLFYRGQVHYRVMTDVIDGLPQLPARVRPIWTLVDVDFREGGPPLANPDVWPIQASSPKPIRWKSWRKQLRGCLWGMPKWDMDELMKGLCLRTEYNSFRSKLERCLDGSTPVPTGDRAVDFALGVLRKEREKKAEQESQGEMGDEIGAQDVDMADGPGQPQDLDEAVDDAFEILLRNATEEIGFAPLDAYEFIFDPDSTKKDHSAAVEEFDYQSLRSVLVEFSKSYSLPESSNRVVAVYPLPTNDNDVQKLDNWKIEFKSVRIAEQLMLLMQTKEVDYLREMYHLYRRTPNGSSLAGWAFESLIHRMLSSGWLAEGTALESIRMGSTGGDSPVFSTASSSASPSTPDTQPQFPAPTLTRVRNVTPVRFTKAMSCVTLDENAYYIPGAENNPLFDSFTVDVDRNRNSAVISVFQITISPNHQGSANGYILIRKIMARVRTLLKEAHHNPIVKVNYFLVCPKDGSEHRWRMPVGWNKGYFYNDHRGEAFCIYVPGLGNYGLP